MILKKSKENYDNEKKEKNKNKGKNHITLFNIIIIIVAAIVLIIEIGFCIYCFNKKLFQNNRRKRANELADDNYDYLTINNNN